MSVFTNLNQLTKEKFTGTILFKDLIVSNLIIPDYQRAYVWDKERVKILLEDLDEYLDMKSNENKPNTYLLGSLILHKNNDTNEFEVVDGQQRLVSLALILHALNDSDSSEFLGKSEFAHSESKKAY